MGRARSRLASAFFQRDVQIAARCLPERGEAKGYCRQKHDSGREQQDLAVEADQTARRKVERDGRNQCAQSPIGRQEAGARADQGDQEAFGKELAQQTSRPRADSQSDGHLALARANTGKHEAGHIHTSNEKEKSDCAEKHDQARTRIAGEPAMVVAHKQTAIFRWKLPEDDLQVCLRLSNADARLQARDHARVRSLVAERVTQV